jgi:RND family efflux transporter MFP subunit
VAVTLYFLKFSKMNTNYSFCLLLSAAFVFSSCGESKVVSNEAPQSYKVTSPQLLDTVYASQYVAEIQSLQNVDIRSQLKGYLDRIHVDEGSQVKAGQLLFSMNTRGFQQEILKSEAQLKSALAELKYLEVEMKNTRLLVDKKIVSDAELALLQAKKEMAEAKIEESRAGLAASKLRLSYAQIRAPFPGTINRIPNKPGSLVEEGELLTSISNNQEVFAYFSLSETEYLAYRELEDKAEYKNARLVLANGETYGHEGKIELNESEFDAETGNIAFRVRFANPKGLLKHGGNGKIILYKNLKNALVIPQRSTFEIQDKLFAFVVDKDDKVRQREIQSSLRLPHLFVVSEGLKADDRIILEGLGSLRDGDQIKSELVSANDPQLISQVN